MDGDKRVGFFLRDIFVGFIADNTIQVKLLKKLIIHFDAQVDFIKYSEKMGEGVFVINARRRLTRPSLRLVTLSSASGKEGCGI